jgi:hypothetical protein
MTTLGSGKKIRVVVFHQGALGDFLVAASAIDELADGSAGICIDFWSKPEHVALLTGKSYAGECHSPDGTLVACLLQDSLWRTVALPDFLLKADLVLIFGQTGSRVMAERLDRRLSANVRWIQSFPASGNTGMHVSEFLRRQLIGFGWPISGKPLRLSPPVDEKQAATDFLHRLGIFSPPILVHPGSGGRHKVWPLGNWYGLIEWLRSKLPCQGLLSIGPADEYMEEFSLTMREAGVTIVSGLPLLRLAALLSLCALYVGSDSGVSHLAAAVGVPTIAVFGPTDPGVWGPRGNNVATVRKRWKEADVFAWTPIGQSPPMTGAGVVESPVGTWSPFRDKEITGLVLAMIRGNPPGKPYV